MRDFPPPELPVGPWRAPGFSPWRWLRCAPVGHPLQMELHVLEDMRVEGVRVVTYARVCRCGRNRIEMVWEDA